MNALSKGILAQLERYKDIHGTSVVIEIQLDTTNPHAIRNLLDVIRLRQGVRNIRELEAVVPKTHYEEARAYIQLLEATAPAPKPDHTPDPTALEAIELHGRYTDGDGVTWVDAKAGAAHYGVTTMTIYRARDDARISYRELGTVRGRTRQMFQLDYTPKKKKGS